MGNVRPLYHLGRFLMMMRQMLGRWESPRMYFKETFRQMDDIGIGSLVIVALVSVFIGAVSAVQFAYQIGGLVPKYYIGYLIRDMSIIELSPTFTCMVLAGKVGSNMTAEIGGMRQKEHIDAMEIMGVNTAGYLIAPRLIAAMTMIPLLVFVSAMVSILGGYLAVVPTGMNTHAEYIQGLRIYYVAYNVFMMFIKAFVFSIILAGVSCYQGYYATGGSIELGNASTRAVVYSNILILLADYVLAMILT